MFRTFIIYIERINVNFMTKNAPFFGKKRLLLFRFCFIIKRFFERITDL